jgi:hypothetical protein
MSSPYTMMVERFVIISLFIHCAFMCFAALRRGAEACL